MPRLSSVQYLPKSRLITKRLLLPLFIMCYLLSACTGYWVAFDENSARQRLILLGIGGVGVLFVSVFTRAYRLTMAPVLAIAAVLSASGLAWLFLVQGDFSHSARGGMIGATVAILLPVAIGTVGWVWGQRWRIAAIFVAILTLSALIGLGATGERTAIFSLMIGGAVAGLLSWISNRSTADTQSVFYITVWLLSVVFCVGIVLYLWCITSPQTGEWLASTTGLDSTNEFISRWVHWRNVLALIVDYPFTGAGLTGTQLTLASYVYINHVPSQPNAHNLYLQVAAEQGWVGALALMVALLVALMLAVESMRSSTKELRWLRIGTLASLVTLIMYGLFDGEVYAYHSAPLIFVPVALTQCLRTSHSSRRKGTRSVSPGLIWGGVTTGVLLLSCLWVYGAALRASLFANLGSVLQTKSELRTYQWPESGIQDALRRDPRVSLDGAITQYEIALALDPHNETALRRLGQIALSRGELPVAESLLTQSLQIAPTRHATRLLLGELYAITERPDEAVELWQTIPLIDGQIEGRLWWYQQRADVHAVERIRQTYQTVQPQD